MTETLVIGYGNELRGDDAAGYRLAERLADDPELAERGATALARRQLTPDLALDLSRVRRVLLVDATTLLPAGELELRRIEVGGSTTAAASSHHMTPAVLLGLAAELYGAAPEGWLLSIGAANLELGDDLSGEVTAGLDRARVKVIELLDA